METEHLEPEFNITAPLGSKIRLLDRLPKSIFKNTPDGMKFARFPNAMRYIHLDLAETSEAGFSVVHKELSDDGEEMVIADI
ncbi:hypothetical protein, partial [Enterobacter hormaechei]|uniref:hypothetical protein n=1 Tax=Enterobacter hormaechei TaxID=158836 RepID=UPI0022F0E71E